MPAARLASNRCRWQGQSSRQSGGEGGDHGVAGASDVVDLAGACRQMQRFGAVPQQSHALLAAGDQQRRQFQLPTQHLALVDQFRLVAAGADDRFEFAQVGRQQGRAPIVVEIATLGVDQHRLAGGVGQLDTALDRAQSAF